MSILSRKPRPQEVESQKKRKIILNYIRLYYDKRGVFPPVANIALDTGYGIGDVNYHIQQLHKQNLIPRPMRRNRKGAEARLPISSLDRKNPRLVVVEYLGGCCVRCGFSDIRALQIDHVNGGGTREKRNGGTYQMYRRLYRMVLNNEVIRDYQVLCANCNWIKRHENHEVATSKFSR